MTILQAFETIPEFRTAKGKRHDLSFVLTCLLLGNLSDCKSWRDHASFVQRHRKALLEHFRPPKDRLPSYSTLRRVALRLDFDALSEAFLTWARQDVGFEPGEWLAIDGKSLSGTSTHPDDARQNFTALVSLYAHKRGVVLQIDAYENKLESEAHIVEAMLASIPLAGAGVTADALHCRKKLGWQNWLACTSRLPDKVLGATGSESAVSDVAVLLAKSLLSATVPRF